MCEIINYIFGSLNSSEQAIKALQKTLRKQKNFNHKTTVLALLVACHTVYSELNRREQTEKIERLEKEIEKLKNDKGE